MSAPAEPTPVTEMGIEPLTDAETESAFFTLIGILDKLNCAPAATVGAKDGRGVTFSLHFSTDRVRRLLDARAALSTRTPEAAQVEILREALERIRQFALAGEGSGFDLILSTADAVLNGNRTRDGLEIVTGGNRKCSFCGEPLHFGTCDGLREHWRNLKPGEPSPNPIVRSGP